MVQQITKGIRISVQTCFEGAFFKEGRTHYAFRYTVSITNQSNDSVQLTARHWEIFDSLNRRETVSGQGVVGKKPVIKPGDTHTYTSGCLLLSAFGAMRGHYTMVNFTNTQKFRVEIPTFRLFVPFAMN